MVTSDFCSFGFFLPAFAFHLFLLRCGVGEEEEEEEEVGGVGFNPFQT